MKGLDVVKDFEKRIWECKDFSAVNEYCLDTINVQSTLMEMQQGVYSLKEMIMRMLEAFPDLTFKFEDYVASNNRIVSRWRATGTHLGYLMSSPPTGKVAEFQGMTLYVVVAGKIRHYHYQAGVAEALRQLEIL